MRSPATRSSIRAFTGNTSSPLSGEDTCRERADLQPRHIYIERDGEREKERERERERERGRKREREKERDIALLQIERGLDY